MNIKIVLLTEPGIPDKERLVLRVASNDNIGRYIVFDSHEISPGSISSRPKNVYWFPDKNVSAGDYIVLYTKVGVNSELKNSAGTTTHVFYWGKNTPLWLSTGDGAILIKAESWEYKTR